MRWSTSETRVRRAGLGLSLATAVLAGVSCRSDDVAGPTPPGKTNPATEQAAAAAHDLSFRQVSAGGGAHTCGVTSDNRAYCWGLGTSGQLGDGGFTNRLRPVAVSGGIQFREVFAGNIHTCGIATDQRVYCWGANGGRLGNGEVGARATPVPVLGGLRFLRIDVGTVHACGLTTSNQLYCWGENQFGQIGDGTTLTRSRPVPVDARRSYRHVSTGTGHTCGITTGYRAFCWGSNSTGMIGDGSTAERRLRPVAVAGTLSFRQLSLGTNHTCGATRSNRAYCWGHGLLGQIGDGTRSDRRTPRAVAGGLSIDRVRAGSYHTCALATDGRAYCWGLNEFGELGNGSNDTYALVPDAIAGGLTFKGLNAGGLFTCGTTAAARAYCWGYNWAGQLGDGTTEPRVLPTAVAGPM
jgi:alpha-tubulin suppressor-like RCC1 family protein